MARLKGPTDVPRVVWRISTNAPQGEYIDYSAQAAARAAKIQNLEDLDKMDPREYSWLASSLELLGGVGVTETPMDTLPGELIDEFFKR
jgi:hypothetical protein